jgi:hypothetical protein
MYGIKNYIQHDEDEIIPVVVLPLADWERLVELIDVIKGFDSVARSGAIVELRAIVKKVQP